MPLDGFRKDVIAVVNRNRGPESPFVGGAVPRKHGDRPGGDQDIFTSESGCLDGLVRADRQALEAAGFTVHSIDTGRSGFHECKVMKPMIGVTTLQWAVGLRSAGQGPEAESVFAGGGHVIQLEHGGPEG